MKKLGVLIVVLVLAGSSARAFGGPWGMGPGIGPGWGMNPYFASDLNLTEAQRSQLQSKYDAFVAQMNPLREKMFSKKMELRDLWAKANPDQAKISAKQQEIQALQNQMQEKATNYQLECRQMLTPEQREKMTVTSASFSGWGGGPGCSCWRAGR